MSTFGLVCDTVKTRKLHTCATCDRKIPIGSHAEHTHGMWEGDWQNWYMCMPCYDNHVYEDGEEVSDEDFVNWLYDEPENKCPKCGDNHPNWDWSKDESTVEYYCNLCEITWNKFIGFKKKEEE